jgi:alpha-glucosidase
MSRRSLVLILWLLGTPCGASAQLFASSPSGNLVVGLTLDAGGVPRRRVERFGKLILSWSPLGLTLLRGESLASDFILLGSKTTEHDETYEIVAGKTSDARDNYRELRVRLIQSLALRRTAVSTYSPIFLVSHF